MSDLDESDMGRYLPEDCAGCRLAAMAALKAEQDGGVMTDDPREVLKAAGVECAEVDEFYGPHSYADEVDISAVSEDADAAILALATRLAAIVSFFDGEKDIDSAAPWALGEIRRVLAEHDAEEGIGV